MSYNSPKDYMIKPCPNCGNKSVCFGDASLCRNPALYIRCPQCETKLSMPYNNAPIDAYEIALTAFKLVAMWNSRTYEGKDVECVDEDDD